MGDFNDPFMRNQNAAVQARTKAQNRANVLQLKLIGQSHPTGLTNNLLKLFEPRPPLEYKPPPEKRKCPPLTGMAQFVSHFAEPGDPEYAPPVQEAETPAQRRARIHKLRLEKGAEKAAEELLKYDPTNDPNISGDPYKTLFVARLSYETTESRIKREFESYGPIKRLDLETNMGQGFSQFIEGSDALSLLSFIFKLQKETASVLFLQLVRLVTDKETNKPKGYAFIEYMHTRDMKGAYKQADGRKLDGRRVLVDVERGRTVPNWRPRRLGGGLGTTRVGGEDVNQRNSGREQEQSRAPSRSEEPRIREDRHGIGKNPVKEERRERRNGRSPREREKDYEVGDADRGHSRDRETEKEHDHADQEDDRGWYEQPDHYEHRRGYTQGDNERYHQYHDNDHDRYDQMEEDDYHYDRATSESRERDRTRDLDRDYRRSERSLSLGYCCNVNMLLEHAGDKAIIYNFKMV
ncbi:hypothetical protein JRO89_XS08G0157800 [Xanthoceras sorbifolium]|uniref:RRM domain-containing protein n=1 Tax=Xanthoceras sorbifolium TaxID=99658 RepID=A0ABQ8HQ55_9ROSI|nr:hypothetical protein JRO89_XS08G0157800 [Xanthoceras sorbifolium]